MNLWHDLATGPEVPEIVNAVIEIPKGSRNKYELDKESGAIKLDRVLYSALHYPCDYGIIPRTFYDDGDPFDIMVMVTEPTFPGCVIAARPIALWKMLDRGARDYKVLAVPAKDPLFGHYKDIGDVPPHFLREVFHFFEVYKDLRGPARRAARLGKRGFGQARDQTCNRTVSSSRKAPNLLSCLFTQRR